MVQNKRDHLHAEMLCLILYHELNNMYLFMPFTRFLQVIHSRRCKHRCQGGFVDLYANKILTLQGQEGEYGIIDLLDHEIIIKNNDAVLPEIQEMGEWYAGRQGEDFCRTEIAFLNFPGCDQEVKVLCCSGPVYGKLAGYLLDSQSCRVFRKQLSNPVNFLLTHHGIYVLYILILCIHSGPFTR